MILQELTSYDTPYIRTTHPIKKINRVPVYATISDNQEIESIKTVKALGKKYTSVDENDHLDMILNNKKKKTGVS